MSTCFYHPSHDAESPCIGCKKPICQVCRDEGQNGFCGACFKKVSALGAQFTDTKKTGMIAASQKATIVKHVNRPDDATDLSTCFHHFDQAATGTCLTCSRMFCAACLTDAGICSHCARLAEPAARPQPPRSAARASEAAAPKAPDNSKLVLFGVIAVLLVVIGVLLLKR